MEKLISKKLTILNGVNKGVIRDEDNASIITKFTEASISILNADFGFSFGKFDNNDKFELVHRSRLSPKDPIIPKRLDGIEVVNKVGNLFFDSNVKKANYASNTINDLRSYIIIPVRYGDHIFGNIILGYKDQHNFTEDELVLAETIENMVSRAVNINWLIEKEQRSLAMAEKQKTTEVLLSQEKLKTEFVANATHELQTPLAIMKGNVDLALMDKKNLSSAIEALHEINTEINILSKILKDMALLTTSNENVNYVISHTPIDLIKLFDDLTKRLKMMASQKDVKIKIRNESRNEKMLVSGDGKHLEELFINLIKNAVAYGKNGGNVTIDMDSSKDNVIIKVSDDGIGISKEDLPRIFDRFYRGDKAHTHENGNHSGLGLAIAKWAAEIHGGKIEAKSTLGEGSIFTVTLPRLGIAKN